MTRKLFSAVLLVVAFSVPGFAADGDNAASPPEKVVDKPSGAPSFFEGAWTGSWGGFISPSIRQDVTVTIGRRGEKGFFPVEYAWGMVEFRNRTVLPGSLRTKGVEEGDKFSFKWKNKEGRDFEVTLHKLTDNEVKARLDRGGPLGPTEQPYSETTLKRR